MSIAKRKSWGPDVQDRTTQRDLKRDFLYETAARCFTRGGYNGASLTDIAQELGVTKAALYYYVRSKHELFYNLHMLSLDFAEEGLSRARSEGHDGLSRLWLNNYYYILRLVASPVAGMVMTEEGALPPELKTAVVRRRSRLEHELRALIQQGIDDGSVGQRDPKMAALVTVGALNWLPRWYRPGGAWSAREVAIRMSDQLAYGLAADPAAVAALARLPQAAAAPAPD